MSKAATLGMYMIDINLSTLTSWIIDNTCEFYICTNMQKQRQNKKLAKEEVDVRVQNEVDVGSLAVGSYCLSLLSGLIFKLLLLFYSYIFRNIVFVSFG